MSNTLKALRRRVSSSSGGVKPTCVVSLSRLLACRFVGTLKQHTIQGSLPGDEDLNVEHLQLLLLLFHNLSERGRRAVLTLVTQAITEVAQNRDSQLKAVPLNLARMLLVLDYLLHQFSKAPIYLFEQVSGSLSFFEWFCSQALLGWF